MQKHINKFTTLLLLYTICCISCSETDHKILEPGVSKELANLRIQQLSEIKYNIAFHIPDSSNKLLTGKEIIEFNLSPDIQEPLILDFRNPESFVKSVLVNGNKTKIHFKNEHVIIPFKKLRSGKNKIELEFTAGDRALNRNQEYLYTLFVPDRACTAFPCFDQPSLKARFQTQINVPENWIAVSNSPLIEKRDSGNRSIFVFDETEEISTYLYSFVAGKFKSIVKKYDDREITMFHREEDTAKLKNNTDKIFELHYSSLKWLEEYTQINYPFTKFDFVIIPSFQYSGMEHPGAILYRDSRLFLEKNSTIREELNRANLIAHETAHMWFGDLVTMEWFSEVWLKEVFANFMAGKIVNPQYPEVNHKLNFLINHYPASYSVDRTKGANSIEQKLDNMKNAGTLYGDIIYHKAPVVMNQLEVITSREKLQEGLQQYLNDNKYGNATWNDLIDILDNKTEINLKNWSDSWVYEPGMPHYKVQKAYGVDNKLQNVIIEQYDPLNEGRQWNQEISVLVDERNYRVHLKDTFNVINISSDRLRTENILPNSEGFGYGYFELDSSSVNKILNQASIINDPVVRCTIYISLWENMLNNNIEPDKVFNSYINALEAEINPQNINLLLAYVRDIFWKFTSKNEQYIIVEYLETFLWNKIISVGSIGIKTAYFNIYKSVVLTDDGINNLTGLWLKEDVIPNLQLSEQDFTEISYELAVRGVASSDSIINVQLKRIANQEKKEQFKFISKAVSNDQEIRNSFFESLKSEKNREKEPWVIEALYYFHHPLKQKETIKYIRPSLDLLKEIQTTGDIFFPKRWLDATFSGHNSVDAVLEINLFLNENPEFPDNLKNKILQSTDLVFRASIINGN